MIKFLDLNKINQRFETEFQNVLQGSLYNGQYILGENVLGFEAEFARYCGTNYAVGTANGLDALTLILKGYIHLGKLHIGDRVIVPSNTFIATILSVLHAGLEPLFVEPNPKTYNLDAQTVQSYLNQDVKAIVMVHLYGQLADVEGLRQLANNANALLISDAAQAHGAACTYGKAGSLGHAAAFSFYPSKNLGALGDAGAVTTDDEDLYNAVKLFQNYGSSEKYKNEIIGYNSRLDDLQASFLSIKLRLLDADNIKRREIAQHYLNGLKNPKIKLPYFDGSKNHVFYAFVVEVADRATFCKFLDKHGIAWLIHYPIPPHKQPAFQRFSQLKLPIAEQIHKRILSLPISPVMPSRDVETVIEVLNTY